MEIKTKTRHYIWWSGNQSQSLKCNINKGVRTKARLKGGYRMNEKHVGVAKIF